MLEKAKEDLKELSMMGKGESPGFEEIRALELGYTYGKAAGQKKAIKKFQKLKKLNKLFQNSGV
jgi:hypothetical protein